AYEYLKRFTEVKDDILGLEMGQKIADAQSQYDFKKKEQELETYRAKNEELTRLNRHLQELNREKNEFLSMATHDLKNPLTSILLMIETWIEFGVDITKNEALQSLKWLRNMIVDMLNIVINILDVNAIESGELNLYFQQFDLCYRLEALLDNYQQMASAKQLHLQATLPDQKVMVYADPSATTQILDNLVSNAIKYSPIQRNIYIRLIDGEKTVRLEVQDEGQGLSETDLEKLFHKFSRLSARPTGGEHSTGLGLAIVKKLVDAMFGTVYAVSDGKDKGATFIVELPKTPVAEESP
ncbi:MAG: sensor histidine kinase, partial [Gemmatimonadetes bacterium]